MKIHEIKDFVHFESMEQFEMALESFKWKIQSGLGKCFPIHYFEIKSMIGIQGSGGTTTRQRFELHRFFDEKLSELCVKGGGDKNNKFINCWVQEKAAEATRHIDTVVLTVLAMEEGDLTIGQWYDLAYYAISYHFNFRDYHYPNMVDEFSDTYPDSDDKVVNDFCLQLKEERGLDSVGETPKAKHDTGIPEISDFVHFDTEDRFWEAWNTLEFEIEEGLKDCFPMDSDEVEYMLKCRDTATMGQWARLWEFFSGKLTNFCVAGNGDAKHPFVQHWAAKKSEEVTRHIDTMVMTILARNAGEDYSLDQWHDFATGIIYWHFNFSGILPGDMFSDLRYTCDWGEMDISSYCEEMPKNGDGTK